MVHNIIREAPMVMALSRAGTLRCTRSLDSIFCIAGWKARTARKVAVTESQAYQTTMCNRVCRGKSHSPQVPAKQWRLDLKVSPMDRPKVVKRPPTKGQRQVRGVMRDHGLVRLCKPTAFWVLKNILAGMAIAGHYEPGKFGMRMKEVRGIGVYLPVHGVSSQRIWGTVDRMFHMQETGNASFHGYSFRRIAKEPVPLVAPGVKIERKKSQRLLEHPAARFTSLGRSETPRMFDLDPLQMHAKREFPDGDDGRLFEMLALQPSATVPSRILSQPVGKDCRISNPGCLATCTRSYDYL
ncbi:MAG: hypothetical protein L6R35_003947 [Caloplaca aegaea]|nr:MAG: hypothetical protein L6R35_003947 [Caloplaca aegaea]